MTKADHLTQLGSNSTEYKYDSPSAAMLETFENTAGNIVVPFVTDEFTSLCPKTGQPDFAKLEVLYVPDKLCIESKSLKMYLFAYRNHGDFHEDCVRKIADDIQERISAKFIRVFGDFNVRGGIAIKPLFQNFGGISVDEADWVTECVAAYDRCK